MRRATGALIVAACAVSTGCLTGFKHPLGPPEDGFIEPKLVGTWLCTPSDLATDQEPSLVEIVDFDGKQFYIHATGSAGSEDSHSRAVAARLGGVAFLSIRGIGAGASSDWTLMAYALPDADHLTFREVDPRPFEDVVDDALSVRDRLAGRLDDPEVFVDALSCQREEPGAIE